MTDDSLTVFQRLVSNAEVETMLEDLRNLDQITPDGVSPQEADGFELALSFTLEDVPHIIGELEELTEDDD